MKKPLANAKAVGVAELKRRFSEYLDRVAQHGERVVVERRGREVAALVPVAELSERPAEARKGLAAAAGAWDELPDADALLRHVARARRGARDRAAPPLR